MTILCFGKYSDELCTPSLRYLFFVHRIKQHAALNKSKFVLNSTP